MSASEEPENETERGPEEVKAQRPARQSSEEGQEVPLFLRGIGEGRQGNAQDEKDEMGE